MSLHSVLFYFTDFREIKRLSLCTKSQNIAAPKSVDNSTKNFIEFVTHFQFLPIGIGNVLGTSPFAANSHHDRISLFVVNGERISPLVPPMPITLFPCGVIINQRIFTGNDAVDTIFEEVFVGHLNLRAGSFLDLINYYNQSLLRCQPFSVSSGTRKL